MSDVIRVDLTIDNDPLIELSLQDESGTLDANIGSIETRLSNTDYRKLKNKPSINGEVLIDNYDEIDPTVPEWAKTPTKPSYTADEVGAISSESEMSFADIKQVWDSVFK